MKNDNYYALLNLPKSASLDDIKYAYRRLIKQYHPDAGGVDSEMIFRLNLAYETLKDPVARANYDRQLTGNVWYVFGQNVQVFGQTLKDNLTSIKNTLAKEHPKTHNEYLTVYVYPWQAIAGDKVAVKTTHHHLLVPITAFETSLELKIVGAGLPKNDGSFGDLYLTFKIKNPNPNSLSEAQKQAFLRLKSVFGE